MVMGVDERENPEESGWDAPPYEMNRVVRIPEAIPELSVEAGVAAVIDSVYDDGRMLLVDVSGPEAPCDALIHIEVPPEGSALSVVGYSKLGD